MMQRVMGKAGIVLLTALLLLSLLCDETVATKSNLRTLRLCSRNLSDALYVVCRNRGYNEPFSFSEENESRTSGGRGLVEECCYNSCSYEQLEQYCKPEPAPEPAPEPEQKHVESKDTIEETYRIVNLPYSSVTKDLSGGSRKSRMDSIGEAIKRKVDVMKRGRHRGRESRDDIGECKGKADAKRRHRSRHCRCRRRRLKCRQAGKTLSGDVKHLDNKFILSSPTNTSLPSIS